MKVEMIDQGLFTAMAWLHVDSQRTRVEAAEEIVAAVEDWNGAIVPEPVLQHQRQQVWMALQSNLPMVSIEHLDTETGELVFALRFVITYAIPPRPIELTLAARARFEGRVRTAIEGIR